MRRKEREVQKVEDIFDILTRCVTLRLGLQDDEGAYIVPLSFGAEREGNTIHLYFHSAKVGRKCTLLKRQPEVTIESDIFHTVEDTKQGPTTRYECVMGRGRCQELTTQAEKIRGLDVINRHYGYPDYPLETCGHLNAAAIYRITLTTVSGKRNLPSAANTLTPSSPRSR